MLPSMNEIRAQMPGTTVVQKPNQGFSRSLGVLSCGWPFWVPFWPNKKVQNIKEDHNSCSRELF